MDFEARVLPAREGLQNGRGGDLSKKDLAGMDVVLTLLSTADALRNSLYGAVLEESGLTEGKFSMLMSLETKGACGPSELADRMGVAPATVSVMVKRMLKSDDPLISLTTNENDARGRLVSLTAAGRTLIEELLPIYYETIRDISKAVSKSEREDLLSILRRLQKRL